MPQFHLFFFFFKLVFEERIINHRRSNNLHCSALPQAAASKKLTFSAVIEYEICSVKLGIGASKQLLPNLCLYVVHTALPLPSLLP